MRSILALIGGLLISALGLVTVLVSGADTAGVLAIAGGSLLAALGSRPAERRSRRFQRATRQR
ncbi:MAG TPA: hypothetical protein VH987_07315 [Candidatus Limnocylindria bacterium]|jgi:hypothetical protein